MSLTLDDTEELLRQAAAGEGAAREQLLDRHRDRLRHLVATRLDRRLAARIDPSDIIQEAMADAAHKFPEYLRSRPLPFYPWLRQLALERLVVMHRRHVQAEKRSVTREECQPLPINDESTLQLADRLLASGSTPVGRLLREELQRRVQEALAQLDPRDREVLVLRHLEQLSTRETAAVMNVSEGAVKTRHLRALRRFRGLMSLESEEAP
jgi:RNA polymerase sigma-70 factor (ECF subfamily)